ncbi:MAG: alpha/beta fold hydrolase [Planctomycetota bacterium]
MRDSANRTSQPRPSTTRRSLWLALAAVYAVGVLATNLVIDGRRDFTFPLSWYPETASLPPMSNDGPIDGEPLTQIYKSWGEPAQDATEAPIILLHGSPGSATNFYGGTTRPGLGRLLGETRRTYALDLPGMGRSRSDPPTRSSRSHAHAVLAFMDTIGTERAHIVGWSNGGAVALNMADIDIERVASIVLLGSVGDQAVEGSGSYRFEQLKYEIGLAATYMLERLTPHIGLLELREPRNGLRNFDDTDQRPLAGIMQNLDTPTLILHGRDDFLVADWAAEHHHGLMPRSTLIMTEHDHFMPFLAAEETANHINKFVARFDDPNAEPTRQTIDLAPRVKPFGNAGEAALDWLHFAPVLLVLPLVTLVGWLLPGRAWVAVLVGATELDIGVAWLGLAIGKAIRAVRNGNSRKPVKWAMVVLDPLAQLGLGFLFVQLIVRPLIRVGPDSLHGIGWLLGVLVLAALFVALPRIWTTRGRQKLKAAVTRLIHHEWWPSWTLYAPLLPLFAWWSIKYRHPLAFTACNPGIPNGGGFAGESKADITASLVATGDPRVLYGEACEPVGTPGERATAMLVRLEAEPRLGGLPVMLKPDAGEQGRGVTRCDTATDIEHFFERQPGRALVQRYDPGPCEYGVMYIRVPAPGSRNPGRILCINRKQLPAVTGDGQRSLEQLVWSHERFRCQADLFLERLGIEASRVPAEGEAVRLGSLGNHAQGCAFIDAPELITPELEDHVCALAEGFGGPDAPPLDVGRFDLRAVDEASLVSGEFAVVEVNGVTSEPASLYDPQRGPLFAWRLLAKQWSTAYRLGAARAGDGSGAALGPTLAARLAWSHLRNRPPAG